MATIPEVCEFVVGPDKLCLNTNVNNNELRITTITATPEDLASLTLLINSESDLKIRIKVNV